MASHNLEVLIFNGEPYNKEDIFCIWYKSLEKNHTVQKGEIDLTVNYIN